MEPAQTRTFGPPLHAKKPEQSVEGRRALATKGLRGFVYCRGPMAGRRFHTVARVEDVPPGTVATVRAGETEVALANVDNRFYATQNECLHLQGPLGEGRLEEHVLSCPWHGWQYDVRTGGNEFDRAIELRTYEVRVENGEIRIAL